nr:reverse transcriptase domain-containing protein [Tanacetum cinerariifolium]
MGTTAADQSTCLLLGRKNIMHHAPSQPGVSPTERNQSSPDLGFIGKYPSRDFSHGTPTTPSATSTVVRDSFKIQQVESSVEGCKAKGKEGQRNNDLQKGKVINMVQYHDRKRKTTITNKKWMNVPITFPPVLARDLLEEALVVEGEIEGYLVRRIHVDEGASVEIMFEQCFNMLHPSIRARLVETQTTVSGFSGEQVKPLGKIELDVCFEGSGLCRRAIMKFTIFPAPSPYNIILGRPCLKQLRSIPSTIHGMMNKIESVMGFPLKCFFDAYKGYHQVQMAEDDEEKTSFYTDHDTYYYTKMSFGLKNIRATYRRLVDEAFQSQIGQNLEVYMDDMMVKNKSEREMLADISKTFDNLRKINMKLNLKKCSFRVEEGKFLGYMVTSEGIRANTTKTKDIAEMKSPKTWGRCRA